MKHVPDHTIKQRQQLSLALLYEHNQNKGQQTDVKFYLYYRVSCVSLHSYFETWKKE